MTDATLRQALAYARRGWPVFPCLPGQKIPATKHGYLDATTDEQQITTGSVTPSGGTWPSPPAPPAPTSSMSTSTAKPETAISGSPACAAPDWSTAPPPTYGPQPAECTPTSLARTSIVAACPATT